MFIGSAKDAKTLICPCRYNFRALYSKLQQAADDIRQLVMERDKLHEVSNQVRAELDAQQGKQLGAPIVSTAADAGETAERVTSGNLQPPKQRSHVLWGPMLTKSFPTHQSVFVSGSLPGASEAVDYIKEERPVQQSLGAGRAIAAARPVSRSSNRSQLSNVSSVNSDTLRDIFETLHYDVLDSTELREESAPSRGAGTRVPASAPRMSSLIRTERLVPRNHRVRNYNIKDDEDL